MPFLFLSAFPFGIKLARLCFSVREGYSSLQGSLRRVSRRASRDGVHRKRNWLHGSYEGHRRKERASMLGLYLF